MVAVFPAAEAIVGAVARAAAGEAWRQSMKTRHFLNAVDRNKVLAAIAKAEKRTTGEIFVFVSRKNVADALAEATRCFKKYKMDRTALRNDVLIFIAPRSHSFAVVGDVGVHAKCGEGFWNEVVEQMRPRLQHGDFTDALVHGIERVGSLLAVHFPAAAGDGKHPSGGVVED
jgi:uncharacterized membrane protein